MGNMFWPSNEWCSRKGTQWPKSTKWTATGRQKRNTKRTGRKHHGKWSYKVTRQDYKPPTVVLPDPEQDGKPTGNPKRIHEILVDAWSDVYKHWTKRHQEAPVWNTFKAKYGQDVPFVEAPNRVPTGEELYAQVQAMKTCSASGSDGWSVEELKALPLEIWQMRARVEQLADQLGKLPTDYQEASMAMLPKGFR